MLFKKKKSASQVDTIYSPVDGRAIPLERVNDLVFSKKLLGDGIAFILEGDTIYAPCSGEIVMIAETKHAFGIKSNNGTEIILHIGLDTVNLNGEGMTLLVKKNTKVDKNIPILKIDRNFMNENNVDLTIILIIVKSSQVELSIEKNEHVKPTSIVMKTKRLEEIMT